MERAGHGSRPRRSWSELWGAVGTRTLTSEANGDPEFPWE
jgi:hypothetical protein